MLRVQRSRTEFDASPNRAQPRRYGPLKSFSKGNDMGVLELIVSTLAVLRGIPGRAYVL